MNGEIRLLKQTLLLRYGAFVASSFIAVWLFLQLGSISAPTLAKVDDKELFYLALGDSLTAGIGATETNYLRLSGFVPQLTSYLRETQPVYVENHGIPGLTSGQLFRYVQEGLGMTAKLAEADLITITIGGNDLLQLLTSELERQMDNEKLSEILQTYSQHIQKTFKHIRQVNPEVPIYILDLFSPFGIDHPLHQISKQVVTSFNAQLNQLVETEENIYMVSVYPYFLHKEEELTHITKDDVHPNDQGYQVIFKAFQQYF